MAWWPAACTQHHTARGLTTPPQYQPSNRAAVANGTKTAKAQPRRLEFPAGPLMRLHPQGLIQGRHLRDGTARGDTVRPGGATGSVRHRLVIWRVGKALTPQRGPTGRAGGPGGRPTGPFGQHGFDEVDREDTGDLPRGQDQRGEGGGVFDRTQQTLHRRIIMAYAVVRHSIGNRSPLESLARDSKSVPHFRCYASPPPTEICALPVSFQ